MSAKTKRKVEWEIPQGKNPKITIRVREAGSLGTTAVSVSMAELQRTIGLLEYVTQERKVVKLG